MADPQTKHCWPETWREAAIKTGFATRTEDGCQFLNDGMRDKLEEFGRLILSGGHTTESALRQELEVTDRLLQERDRLLRAIPECPVHGACVPHALEWVKRAKMLTPT